MTHPSTPVDSPPLQPPSNFFFPHRSSGPLCRVTIVRCYKRGRSSDAIVFILFQESLGFCVDFDRSPPSKIDFLLLPISQVVMEQQPSLSSLHRASFRTPNSQVPGLETDCFMFFLHLAAPSASDHACPRWGVVIVVVDDPPSFRTLDV